MPNLTTTYGWQQPLVADAIDADLWGGELNSNLAAQDTLLSTVGITPAGALAVKSTNFTIVDGTDATKVAEFDTSAITTATTRTLAVQDVSGTVYVTGGEPVAVTDGGTGVATVAAAQAAFGIFQHMEIFNSTGTFTPATGVTNVYIEVWGAGGAGGGQTSNNGSAPGGGAGGYAAGFITVTPATGCAVTIGEGGSGGTGTGGTGGTSSFAGPSLTISASGGAGGTGSTTNSTALAGGGAGSGTNGTLNITGQAGDSAYTVSGQPTIFTSGGGSAPRGGLGGKTNLPGGAASNANGGNGTAPGAGGGGGIRNTSGSASGGSGASGMVIVYYP